MTADIVRYEDPTPDPETSAMQRAADFKTWAPKLAGAAAIAREICQTEFVPAPLRGKPAAVAAAILAGSEIGIGPMASLNQIHIIDGRPALSAELARALVLAQGHHMRFREMTTTRCVVDGRRRGEDDWTTVTWTMDDAKAAGLQGRGNWRRYPRRMLAARATGELCRMLFADALAGMAWTADELQDESDDVALNGTQSEATGKPRTAKRKTTKRDTAKPPASKPQPIPEPADVTPEPDGPPLPDEPGGDTPVTPAQMTKLQAIFTEHDIADRDQRLAISSGIVNRDLSSSKDLTLPEAAALIDTLERAANSADGFHTAIDGITSDQHRDDGVHVDLPDTITPDDTAALVAIITNDRRRTKPDNLTSQQARDLATVAAAATAGAILIDADNHLLATPEGVTVTVDQIRDLASDQ